MAKQLDELFWIEELLPDGYIRKPMFGGFAFYLEGRLILVLFENSGDREYKKKKYDFDLWNGCLFPSERVHHAEILSKFPDLMNHPVLPKWLYLPIQTEDFDDIASKVLKELRRRSQLFGVIPKAKKIKAEKPSRYVPEGPRMFSDEPIAQRLEKGSKVSDLKNLGPASEVQFSKAGIRSASQLIKLGWKAAMKKLVKSNPKNRNTIFAYAVIGAIKNVDWFRLDEVDKQEAKDLMKALKK